jgi:hypothetical protein
MNGARRPELDGCHDIDLACTPFTNTLPIRRLPLHPGDSAELAVIAVDVETLAVATTVKRYHHVDERHWRVSDRTHGTEVDFGVDEYGLVLDLPHRFRRR